MLRERVEVFTETLRRAPSKDVPRWTAMLGARVSPQVFPWRLASAILPCALTFPDARGARRPAMRNVGRGRTPGEVK